MWMLTAAPEFTYTQCRTLTLAAGWTQTQEAGGNWCFIYKWEREGERWGSWRTWWLVLPWGAVSEVRSIAGQSTGVDKQSVLAARRLGLFREESGPWRSPGPQSSQGSVSSVLLSEGKRETESAWQLSILTCVREQRPFILSAHFEEGEWAHRLFCSSRPSCASPPSGHVTADCPKHTVCKSVTRSDRQLVHVWRRPAIITMAIKRNTLFWLAAGCALFYFTSNIVVFSKQKLYHNSKSMPYNALLNHVIISTSINNVSHLAVAIKVITVIT